jgi:hypothetical protein
MIGTFENKNISKIKTFGRWRGLHEAMISNFCPTLIDKIYPKIAKY